MERVTAMGMLVAGNRWLLARRGVQLAMLMLFLLGPWAGRWWVKGSLAASTWFETVLLVDPYVLAQTLAAGHTPEWVAVTGALVVLGVYTIVGGRAYCSWFCPVNLVTDAAAWTRTALDIRGGWQPPRRLRGWILVMTLVVSAITGAAAWEWVNPVSLMQRSLLFGAGLGWLAILALFLFDVVVSARGWCGHVCPVGAFYGVIGCLSLVRIIAARRTACTDCGACFRRCPEPQVLVPALKAPGSSPVPVLSGACTRCGRCIDVCPAHVFEFGGPMQRCIPSTVPGQG